MGVIDRLLTIAVTATLTSAAWIVVGGLQIESGNPAEPAQKSRNPTTVAERTQPTSSTAENNRFVASEHSLEMEPLLIPVKNVTASQLSNTFSDQRGGGQRLHEALDIMAPAGTPVIAAGSGTLEKLFRSDAGGNTIYVRSPDRSTIHYYAHLQAYAPGLKEGQEITRGQQLGSVGSSGNANPAAPHLHFAILRTTPDAQWWEPATAINPFSVLRGT